MIDNPIKFHEEMSTHSIAVLGNLVYIDKNRKLLTALHTKSINVKIFSITDLLPPNLSKTAFPTQKQLNWEESAQTATN